MSFHGTITLCVIALQMSACSALFTLTRGGADISRLSKEPRHTSSNRSLPKQRIRGGSFGTIMSDSTITAAPEGPREGGAVIIGGGPSGLAAALMLAKRGWTDISIIEKSPSADHYDPSVAYV